MARRCGTPASAAWAIRRSPTSSTDASTCWWVVGTRSMPSRYRSRGRRRALIVLCLLPAAVLAQAPPRVEDLRERATTYVDQFIGRFSGVVAEERLLQETSSLPGKSGEGTNQRMNVATPGRREIRSDFLFVRRAASENWHVYRDAFEVDGRAVRDRGDRLMKLLTAPSLSNEQLALKIAQE